MIVDLIFENKELFIELFLALVALSSPVLAVTLKKNKKILDGIIKGVERYCAHDNYVPKQYLKSVIDEESLKRNVREALHEEIKKREKTWNLKS